MSFHDMLQGENYPTDNGLSDGVTALPYTALPRYFAQLESFFSARNVPVTTCISLESENSVAGAVVLLFFLYRGQSFFLLPPVSHTANPPSLPLFSQHYLQIKTPLATESARFYADLPTFLVLEANPDYDPACGQACASAKRLYARTSGSMGMAKIVVHDHDKLFANIAHAAQRFQLSAADRVFIPVPIFHLYGLGAGFLPACYAQATIELQHKSNILRYMERERIFQPTAAFLTPTLCKMLVNGHRKPRPYRLVVSAGDKMQTDLFLAFSEKFGSLVNLYGSTEMGAIVTSDLADPPTIRAQWAGKPMPTAQVRIDQQGLETPAGDAIGEVYLRYPAGFIGYVNEQGQAIMRNVDAEGWFKTGDLGQLHDGGYVEILGRCDLSINRRGYLVLLSDLEKHIEQIKDVEKAIVVTSAREGKEGQHITAFCVATHAGVDNMHLRSACFDVLPNYAIPDEVYILPEIPLLPSGKVDRQKLARMADSSKPEL